MSRCLTRALHRRTNLASPAHHLLLGLPSRTSSACIPPSFTSTRQLVSTTTTASPAAPQTAAEAASHLLSTLSGKTTTRRQFLDGNQLQRLSLTLNRKTLLPSSAEISDISSAPPPGTLVPPGYHLVYFTPGGVEEELGPDGTDRTFNAPAPFTRRMWAGGKMTWSVPPPPAAPNEEGGYLRVGDEVEERTRLVGAVAKRSGRDGSEMVVVDVEKEFRRGDGELLLVDQRSWVFRPELEAASSTQELTTQTRVVRGPSTVQDYIVDGDPIPRRRHTWSPVALFRFSALTFNAHRIHYDQSWSRAVESHSSGSSIVVHGPLNLICMLDYFRDVVIGGGGGGGGGGGSNTGIMTVREIKYRAVSPLYAGQEYDIRAVEVMAATGNEARVEGAVEKQWEVFVERGSTVCMKATITTTAALS